MKSKEAKDSIYCVPDFSVNFLANGKVLSPPRKGICQEATAESNILRSSKISTTEMALEPMTGPHGGKIDKNIGIVSRIRSLEKRIMCEKIYNLPLSEKMSITGKGQIERQIQSLEIRALRHQYFKNNTILFKIPENIRSCEEWVRTKMSLVWQRLEDELGDRLSFQFDNHCLRIMGTYSDSCTVSYFDAQV